jgi:hypothetical protein
VCFKKKRSYGGTSVPTPTVSYIQIGLISLEHQAALEDDKRGMAEQHLLIQKSTQDHLKLLSRLEQMYADSKASLDLHEEKTPIQMEDMVCELEEALEREQRQATDEAEGGR